MTISNDVFMSILAMDSYNRGYSQGPIVSGSQVGSASLALATDPDLDLDAVSASFFAQSYTWNGSTVISYRGTNDLIWDPVYGWGLGLGYPETPQADMAAA